MDRLCIIADTPYQLLNSINYYLQVEKRNSKADLYVDLKYEASKRIVKQVKQMDLFDRVILFENDISETRKNNNALYRAKRFMEVALPILRVEHCLKSKSKVYRDFYSKIICFSGIEFAVAMIRINAYSEVILLDEGNASVVMQNPLTDQYKRTMGKKEYIYRLAGLRIENLVVSSLYLYNPSLYQFRERKFEIKKLPSLDHNDQLTADTVSRIFGGWKDDNYEGKNVIYLAQPLNTVTTDYIDVECKIAKVLKEHAATSIVRLHPALKDVHFYDIDIDRNQLMWELLCKDYVKEDSILIAYSSSAQLSPKTMYDKEPYLIYTYKLYKQSNEERNSCDRSVKNIKQIYRNQRKIFIPDSIEELNSILKKLGQVKSI